MGTPRQRPSDGESREIYLGLILLSNSGEVTLLVEIIQIGTQGRKYTFPLNHTVSAYLMKLKNLGYFPKGEHLFMH